MPTPAKSYGTDDVEEEGRHLVDPPSILWHNDGRRPWKLTSPWLSLVAIATLFYGAFLKATRAPITLELAQPVLPPTLAESAGASCTTETTDVVVIGAGMAGVRATARIQEMGLNVIVLEATDIIGGRVRGFDAGDYRMQLGANWLYSYGASDPHDNAVSQLYRKIIGPKKFAEDDFLNTTIYELFGCESHERCSVKDVTEEELDQYIHLYKTKRIPCLENLESTFWQKADKGPRTSSDPKDVSVLEAYRSCGWNESNPMDFLIKSTWYDYDSSTIDGSIFGFGDSMESPEYFVTGDFSEVVKTYAKQQNVSPRFGKRVVKIDYDYDADLFGESGIRAGAHVVDDTSGACSIYYAKRILSTVSSGVYNHGLMEFDPPLQYSDEKYNPMKIHNYVKIWYEFPTNFWETADLPSHYVMTLPILEKLNTNSVFWQNLNRPEIFPGSNMLMLTLFEEGFAEAVGEANVRKPQIDEDLLSSLLDPLRHVFPGTFEEPTAVYHNYFHGDPNFGYGAYSQWVAGFNPYDYFHFWGAYDEGDFVLPCDHNGCNQNGEWVLFLGGTDMCNEDWATVHGAYYGGEYSANLLMESLGLDLGDWKQFCYVGARGPHWGGDDRKK